MFDILCSLILVVLMTPILIILWPLVRLTSKGQFLHWSKRVGKEEKIYFMPKIRTMNTDTPQVATHLIENPESMYTPLGSFLRRTSIDEIPQLFSVLKGDMSLVGPRPALFNQYDLMALRRLEKIEELVPGVTGWAQVNGRDDLSIEEKVKFEIEYKYKKSAKFDFYIICLTVYKLLKKDGISH